jgi:hypothetical protein
MKRDTIWTGACATMVSFATAGMLAQTAAQTPTPPTPQTSAPQQSSPSSTDKKMTVTGCLKAAPQMPGDTASAANPNPTGTAGTTPPAATGTAGAAADAKFILTGATASPAEAASAAQTYRLIANPTALGEHVGKKLELVGTLDPNSTPDPKDPSAAAPAFRVESGKIVAASCNE